MGTPNREIGTRLGRSDTVFLSGTALAVYLDVKQQ